ncbi:MAG: 50S ribosomal protein L24 [Lentisphaerae bacterium]|nr:50S ribosomal protein L24 [Lentisphaerota bacterium]
MSTHRIRKNDTVIAVTGVDAGKTGKIMQVTNGGARAIVEGLNLRKKCLRKSQDNPQGGITEKEVSVSTSNVMLYCPDCKKGVRLKRAREAGKPVRQCRSCGRSFDG